MNDRAACPINGKPCYDANCEERCQKSGDKLDRVTARTDAVVDAVCADLQGRSQFGIKKYGSTLAENSADHRAKLEHIYNEVLDAANYLKWAMMELDKLHAVGVTMTDVSLHKLTRLNAFEESRRAALGARLPDGYQWGADALEQFDFGKQRAAEAINDLKKR